MEGTTDVMTWLETVGESIVVLEDEVETLTDVNLRLKKIEDADRELVIKKKQIQDLKVNGFSLSVTQIMTNINRLCGHFSIQHFSRCKLCELSESVYVLICIRQSITNHNGLL